MSLEEKQDANPVQKPIEPVFPCRQCGEAGRSIIDRKKRLGLGGESRLRLGLGNRNDLGAHALPLGLDKSPRGDLYSRSQMRPAHQEGLQGEAAPADG